MNLDSLYILTLSLFLSLFLSSFLFPLPLPKEKEKYNLFVTSHHLLFWSLIHTGILLWNKKIILHPVTFLVLAVLQGYFEVLSLSGSFFFSEINGQHRRTGGLAVALASSDGSILGGSIFTAFNALHPREIYSGLLLGSYRIGSQASTNMFLLLIGTKKRTWMHLAQEYCSTLK